jgi:hypothetical protein
MDCVMKRTWVIVSIVIFCLITACSMPVKRATDPKTVSEQLLISQAIKKSLTDLELGFPQGTTISLEASGLTADHTVKDDITQRYVKKVIAGWLGKQGLFMVEDGGEATLRVQAIIESVGTRRGVRFFGMPAASSMVLPVSIPELTLWKRDQRQGFVRFYLDIFDGATGQHVSTTQSYTGSVRETGYTVFFFFRWEKSNMDEPLERL